MAGDTALDPSLAVQSDAVSPDIAAGIARAHYAIDGIATPLPGEKDDNFAIAAPDGTRIFLKIVSAGEPPDISDFHTAALVHLADRAPDLPVQRLRRTAAGAASIRLAFQDGLPRTVRATAFADGIAQTDCPRGPAQSRAIGAVAARLQIALEDFAHPADAHRTTWDLRHAGALLGNVHAFEDAARSDRVARALATFAGTVPDDLPVQVVHNDMNTDNVLMRADDPTQVGGIIDFGDMVRTARVFDAAIGAAHQMGAAEDPLVPACAFLDGFTARRPLTPPEIALLPAAIAARMAMRLLIPKLRAHRMPDRRAYILRNDPTVWRQFARLDAMDPVEIADRLAGACA